MTSSDHSKDSALLLMVAGAKGAVASTVAVAVAMLQKDPETVLSSLTTRYSFPYLPPPRAIHMTGWDNQHGDLTHFIKNHGVLPENIWRPYASDLDDTLLLQTPPPDLDLKGQVEHLVEDMHAFCKRYSGARPILVNLLPAGVLRDLSHCNDLTQLYSAIKFADFPDLAYVLAAIFCGIPVVNFTPNALESPVVVQEAIKRNVPICGCDGKTGQTFLKVVLASALKARSFYVDGWYSLNILGNADGKNLMDPGRAAGKVANKTNLLDKILGYTVGEHYDAPSHKVHIDYYPPRGDAKEAWDVIDFQGMFGLPMSIRLNLLGRDSILAAP
ncbi:MAG: inositol-3-phosphate synthase, partial [Proteobacteria bacterium]|nr:inositol-3-phosphate synthase [Pseudomonadota bacterium]